VGKGEPFGDSVEMLAVRGRFETYVLAIRIYSPAPYSKRIAERKFSNVDVIIEARANEESIMGEQSCFARSCSHVQSCLSVREFQSLHPFQH